MPQIEREDEATRILTELGYRPDNPLRMEIRYDSSENNRNTAVAIQEQAEAARNSKSPWSTPTPRRTSAIWRTTAILS